MLRGTLLKTVFESKSLSDEKKKKDINPEVEKLWNEINDLLTACKTFEKETHIDISLYVESCETLLKSEVFASDSWGSKLRVALSGCFSCGKSRFINDLLDKDIAPVDSAPTTRMITRFTHGSFVEYYNESGKKVSKENYQRAIVETGGRQVYEVRVPSDFLKNIILSDVPGFDSGDSAVDSSISIKENNEADMLFFLCAIGDGTVKQHVLDYLLGKGAIPGVLEGVDGKKKKLYVILTKVDLDFDPIKNENKKKSILRSLSDAGIKYEDVFFYAALTDPNAHKEELLDEDLEFIENEKNRLKETVRSIAEKNGDLVTKRKMAEAHLIFQRYKEDKRRICARAMRSKNLWRNEFLKSCSEFSPEIIDCSWTEWNDNFESALNIYSQMIITAINSLKFCRVHKNEGLIFDNYYIDSRDGEWQKEWTKKQVSIDVFVESQPDAYKPYLKLSPSLINPKFDILDTYDDSIFGNREEPVYNQCKAENQKIRNKWTTEVVKYLSFKQAKFADSYKNLFEEIRKKKENFENFYKILMEHFTE